MVGPVTPKFGSAELYLYAQGQKPEVSAFIVLNNNSPDVFLTRFTRDPHHPQREKLGTCALLQGDLTAKGALLGNGILEHLNTRHVFALLDNIDFSQGENGPLTRLLRANLDEIKAQLTQLSHSHYSGFEYKLNNYPM